MQIKSILAGAAIALVAGLGSASAGDEFSTPDSSFVEPVSAFATLDGMTTEPMNQAEMDAVRGATAITVTVDGMLRTDISTPISQRFSLICVTVTLGEMASFNPALCP